MTRNVKNLLLTALLAIVCASSYAGNTLQRALNGNFYEAVIEKYIDWPTADSAAKQRTLCLTNGHLATIHSDEENTFINNLRTLALEDCTDGSIACSQVWIGGYQDKSAAVPNEGWHWVNGEGDIPGANGSATYSNWAVGEPNDTPAGENYLTMGRYSNGTWNDEGTVDRVGGYIVEYEQDMTVNISKCDSDVQNIVLDAEYCTISDYTAVCIEENNNHGDFVSCVAQMAKWLVDEGMISKNDKGKLITCAMKAKDLY